MGKNDKGWKSDFLWLLSAKSMEKINSEHFSRYPVTKRIVSECLERQRKYTDERGVVDGAAVLRNCRRAQERERYVVGGHKTHRCGDGGKPSGVRKGKNLPWPML
jgi:hypothetical protein